MDVPGLLKTAALLIPAETVTQNGITVTDIRDSLDHREWEVALDLLEELGDVHPLPLSFWQGLATAAERMRLDWHAAWCHWRAYETRYGTIRADLTLTPADSTAYRRTPIPGAGVLRPAWDIGHRTTTGEPELCTARLWVEYAPSLEPGGRASVRLAPLSPSKWQLLQPGRAVTMHEDRTITGTAVVVEVLPPPALESA
ncbi:hypothetical protein GCM10009716_35910 [Streptomyces sodiiphilus]|uniref:Uncharacterized protein n=1 Tax=Streptomyces sodiiphilus TaxID=226217 RepID=A0ABN2PKU3_9ACTN